MGAPKTADQIPTDADARERINGTELYGPLFFLSVLAGARDGDADVRVAPENGRDLDLPDRLVVVKPR